MKLLILRKGAAVVVLGLLLLPTVGSAEEMKNADVKIMARPKVS